MATADELIAELSESVVEHAHNVTDSDNYFIIDTLSRQITNSGSSNKTLMQFDHNSERFTFEVPRYIEGHDMMLCNSVKVHYNNIGIDNEENADVYDVDDLRVDPKNSSNVICSWLISRNATMYSGILSFSIQYACVDSDGNLVYEWRSDIYSDIEIKASKDNSESSISEYTDILEQWRTNIFGAKDSLISEIQTASETEQTEIAAKGAETLATIPEDYTEVANMADEALRRKANAILITESGEQIYLDDSSDCNLVGLNVYGKTTQVSTTGSNMLDPSNISSEILNDKGDLRNGIYVPITETGVYTYYVSGDETTYLGFTSSLSVNATVIGTSLKGSPANGTIELTAGHYFVLWFSPDKAVSTTNLYFLGLGSDLTYEPYTNSMVTPNPQYPQPLNNIESPTVRIYGSNLLNVNDMYNDVFVENADGSCTITKTDAARFSKQTIVKIPAGIRGTLHYEIVGFNNTDNITYPVSLQLSYSDSTTKSIGLYDGRSRTKFVCDKNVEWVRLFISGGEPSGTYVTIRNIWMELESAESEYEPYKPAQSISSVRTFNGIPVSSGGNYTDSDGQQWVCDEIDFERGKYIQRVQNYEFNGTESWVCQTDNYFYLRTGIRVIKGNTGYCSHFKYRYDYAGNCMFGIDDLVYTGKLLTGTHNYDLSSWKDFLAGEYAAGTPVSMVCLLETPIETDLTSTEMEAFRALHTNATNTTILNDQNAMIGVKYVADIKRYIYKNCNVKRKFDLNILESNWVGHDNDTYYSQVMDIEVGKDVKVDLHPTSQQLISLIQDGVSMFVANENGVVTVYSIGGTTGDMTIQATETVVYYE